MKTSKASVACALLIGCFVLGGCATPDLTKAVTLPLAHPLALEEVGGKSDAGTDSTPAIDEWQAKNHADIVGNLTPVIQGGKLTGWTFRWIPSENPYVWHFAYARMETMFSLVDGVSTEDVLNRLGRWRAASLGFSCRPVLLNYSATPLTVRTISSSSAGRNGTTGGLYDDVSIELDELNVHADQETHVYGFWYLYHDPAYSIDLGELTLKLPIGFATPAAYLEHRAQLERKSAPALRAAGGVVEFENPAVPTEDQPVLLERFFVPSGWMDLQPFARQVNGPVVLVKIRGVTAGTPIYRAGVKEGEILRSYQGVALSGLTESELNALLQQPLTSDLRLELMETPRSRPREVVVRLADMQQSLAKRKAP